MRMSFKPKLLFSLLLTALLFLGGAVLLNGKADAARSSGASDPTVVVLTASWCGTCREVIPVVRKVVQSSAQPNLKVVTLDVDSGTAPSDAGAYGITVAGSDVPQVYLYHNGRTVLLYNGKGYKFGQTRQAEAQIRQQLESNL